MGSYLRVNLLGPGPRLIKKKNLPDRGLTKVEKHRPRRFLILRRIERDMIINVQGIQYR